MKFGSVRTLLFRDAAGSSTAAPSVAPCRAPGGGALRWVAEKCTVARRGGKEIGGPVKPHPAAGRDETNL